MSRSILTFGLLVFGGLAVNSARAAGPPPFGGLVKSPFSAELEVYSGAIAGRNVGAAYHSITRGNYGLRFTFGFLRSLNFNLDYLYSNQTRTLTAVTPPIGSLPGGTALVRAKNLNMVFGSGELNLVRTRTSTFYISPGVGFARTGARNLTLVTPLGAASSSLAPGTAVSFNLGAGVKVFPLKHWGIRLDLRDHVSQGTTGTLTPNQNLTVQNTTVSNPQQFFGNPVNNNVVFTLGLIFKIL